MQTRLVMLVRIAIIGLAYAAGRLRPVRPRVVLATGHATSIRGNLAAIGEEIRRRDPSVEIIELRHLARPGPAGYAWGSIHAIQAGYHLARAALFVIDSHYLPVYVVPRRPGTTVVQTWHACGAIKKIGYSVLDKAFGADAGVAGLVRFHVNYDLCLAGARPAVLQYMDAFRQPATRFVTELGIPRTDVLVDPPDGLAASIRERYGLNDGRRLILYAPTFRGTTLTRARHPTDLDLAELARVLGADHRLLLRLHPAVRARLEPDAASGDFVVDVSDYPEVNELMLVADVLVTDYSSVIFEYALLGRPMAFFAPDADTYDDERGFYFDYRSGVPGPVFHATSALAAYLRAGEWDLDRVRAFAREWFDVADGRASERFFDRVVRPALAGRRPQVARVTLDPLVPGDGPPPAPASARSPLRADGDAPLVTVVMTAWNAAATIERSLASVLDERGVDLECVVVDDASTDGTREIVAAIARRDPRVVLVPSPENEGVSAARNRGLLAARGRWLMFLDADDRLLPGGLRALMDAGEGTDALAVIGQRIWTNGARRWRSRFYDREDITQPGRKSLVRNPGLVHYGALHGKAFDRRMVEGITFEGRVIGDVPWTLRALVRAGDRIVVIGETVYEWFRPRGGGASTITSRSRSSAAVAAEAARAATRGIQTVSEELLAAVPDEASRTVVVAAYVERTVTVDLARSLRPLLDVNSPGLPAMMGALREFLDAVPADVLRESGVVRSGLLAPPQRVWAVLSPEARAAWERMAEPVLRLEPGLRATLERRRRPVSAVRMHQAVASVRRFGVRHLPWLHDAWRRVRPG